MSITILRATVAASLFGCYSAELTASGGEFQVNTEVAGSQSNARLASFNSCGYVSVWRSRTPLWQYEIRGQVIGCDGEKVGSEIAPIPNSVQGYHPAVATNGVDQFIVVWESRNVPTGDDILAQLYLSDGTAISSTITVAHTSNDEAMPAVTSLPDGSYIVTWNGVQGQIVSSTGSLIGTPFSVSTNQNDYHINAEVTRLSPTSGNGFVSVWWSQDGHQTGIAGQIFNSDGSKLGSEFTINTNTEGAQSEASVASFPSPFGGFVVVWLSFHNLKYEIVGQLFNANGDKVDGQFQVVDPTSSQPTRPEVASIGFGGFAVVWEEYVTGQGFEIFAQEFTATGERVGTRVQVNTAMTGHQMKTSIASSLSSLYVNWVGKDATGTDGIFAQHYSFPTGGGGGGPTNGNSAVTINGSPLTGTELMGATDVSSSTIIQLVAIPEIFTTGVVYLPDSAPWPVGTVISLTCHDDTPCHFFVSVYSCAPCNSYSISGGLSMLAVHPDYDAGSCAPRFMNNGASHPMVTFHVEVAPASTTQVPETTQELVYFSIIKTDSSTPSPWCFKPKGPHFVGVGSCADHGCPEGSKI
eukprot:TRINITY_DN490_c0_g5_i1.p1 TRINITY_DN490_c0_g5~~TRINITY_DN490_c0_g5_i1.p1  ORF type:complete len:599 (+),score=114.09 TRINITY_DN490_c0_g5_i1:55-1797(+)